MEKYYRTEKHMEKAKASKIVTYLWNDKNYDIAHFENHDGVAIQAFLGDKPASNCIHIQFGTNEEIDIVSEVAKGDVRNGKHEKHNKP
jgi:hypothetical protein